MNVRGFVRRERMFTLVSEFTWTHLPPERRLWTSRRSSFYFLLAAIVPLRHWKNKLQKLTSKDNKCTFKSIICTLICKYVQVYWMLLNPLYGFLKSVVSKALLEQWACLSEVSVYYVDSAIRPSCARQNDSNSVSASLWITEKYNKLSHFVHLSIALGLCLMSRSPLYTSGRVCTIGQSTSVPETSRPSHRVRRRGDLMFSGLWGDEETQKMHKILDHIFRCYLFWIEKK